MTTVFTTDNDRYYFNAVINDPLVVLKNVLRSDAEYEKSIAAEKSALNYLQQVVDCLEGNTYLLTISPSIDKRSLLRTKKGVLWKEKQLRSLKRSNFEVDIGVGTRIVSLVDLEEFKYDSSENLILNWMFSFVIVSKSDLTVLSEYVESWVEKDPKMLLPFNYSVIAQDLLKLRGTTILRYFPADNNRSEALVFVGNKENFNSDVIDRISAINI